MSDLLLVGMQVYPCHGIEFRHFSLSLVSSIYIIFLLILKEKANKELFSSMVLFAARIGKRSP